MERRLQLRYHSPVLLTVRNLRAAGINEKERSGAWVTRLDL